MGRLQQLHVANCRCGLGRVPQMTFGKHYHDSVNQNGRLKKRQYYDSLQPMSFLDSLLLFAVPQILHVDGRMICRMAESTENVVGVFLFNKRHRKSSIRFTFKSYKPLTSLSKTSEWHITWEFIVSQGCCEAASRCLACCFYSSKVKSPMVKETKLI